MKAPGRLKTVRGLFYSMKKIIALFFIISLVAACISQKEIKPPSKKTEEAPLPVKPDLPISTDKPGLQEKPEKYERVLSCRERTGEFFNNSGIEVLPFFKATFFDLDHDGQQELIAGNKDGTLRLYKWQLSGMDLKWTLVDDYFSGIEVGAFSAPAMADIDLDGAPEVIIGSGGFSSESGRVLVYRNNGTYSRPVWKMINMPRIDVGDDAVPALLDVDGDARPDLIVGSSVGRLYLYRNNSTRGRISFRKDPGYFKGVSVGMYGMPAAFSSGNKLVIIVGNSVGELNLFERQRNGKAVWQKIPLKIGMESFSAPAFFQNSAGTQPDLVVSDSNGRIHYFRNVRKDFREWEKLGRFFSGRVMPGPACAPSAAEIEGRSCLITGNINGNLKLFEFRPDEAELPWIEKPAFFDGIKLSGFARGTVTMWKGKYLLVTGQQDGPLRAFLNTGSIEKPEWKEQKNFFRGISKILHASPAVFDLDGDGEWELVIGDVDGNVTGYTHGDADGGAPYWRKIEHVFSQVSVNRYASPALIRHRENIYLFVGQQDGKMLVYTAADSGTGFPVFSRQNYLSDIQVSNHSSPSVIIKGDMFEMAVGDYNGNLRLFACRSDASASQ
jgi:hypothetical protein